MSLSTSRAANRARATSTSGFDLVPFRTLIESLTQRNALNLAQDDKELGEEEGEKEEEGKSDGQEDRPSSQQQQVEAINSSRREEEKKEWKQVINALSLLVDQVDGLVRWNTFIFHLSTSASSLNPTKPIEVSDDISDHHDPQVGNQKELIRHSFGPLLLGHDHLPHYMRVCMCVCVFVCVG